jgi:uncharacterized membrane protein YsdA (DUF1294 family)
MGERIGRPRRAERLHSAVGLSFSLLLAYATMHLLHWSWTGWHVFAAWLIGVNVTTFGYYAFDKLRAKEGGRRVPEGVLHGLALAGGSVGAFTAMELFRHKTIKGRFRLVFLAIVLVQVTVAVWVGYVVWHKSGER